MVDIQLEVDPAKHEAGVCPGVGRAEEQHQLQGAAQEAVTAVPQVVGPGGA